MKEIRAKVTIEFCKISVALWVALVHNIAVVIGNILEASAGEGPSLSDNGLTGVFDCHERGADNGDAVGRT
jgi:hypothetical protein